MINIPHLTTIVLFLLILLQFLLFWTAAKRKGKTFREGVLPNALAVAAVTIVLVREFFGDLPYGPTLFS